MIPYGIVDRSCLVQSRGIFLINDNILSIEHLKTKWNLDQNKNIIFQENPF